MTKSPFSQNREAADILSATNRYTAQHIKAETKRHKWKIMVNKKRQKSFFSIFQSDYFWITRLNKLLMHIYCDCLSEFYFLDRDFWSWNENQAGAVWIHILQTYYCGCTLRVWQRSSSMQSVRDGGREDDTFFHQ